jgi:phosphoribosylformimino-5-aminoimidazole carboxamide ribotide isomerase
MQKETGLNVIASGGIASMDDLYRLKKENLYGAILGRSIYTGAIKLAEAVAACK